MFDDGYVRCSLTGGQCQTSCPHFSTSCVYSKYIPSYFTLGHLYFIIKTTTNIYKDDRVFLIKLLGGDVDIDDEDYTITQHLEELESSIEQELEWAVRRIINDDNIELDNKYQHLYNYINQHLKEKRNILLEISDKQNALPLYKKIEQELKPTPTLFSFAEYINMIVEWVLKGEYSEQLIFDIITYLLIDFKPKNTLDIHYVKWSELDVMKAPGNGIKPIGLLYSDYRKWDSERIELAKSVGKKKQIIVVNDMNWIWWRVLKEMGKVDFSIGDLTHNDILLKEFFNQLLFKLTWKFLSTHIIFIKLNNQQLERLVKLIDYVEWIVSSEYRDKFTFGNICDYFIPEQIKNQYMLIEDIYQKDVDDNTLNQILHTLIDKIENLKHELTTTTSTTTQHTLQHTLKVLEKKLANLKKYKENGVKFIHILPLLIDKTQVSDIDVIDFVLSKGLLKKVKIIGRGCEV